LAVRVVVDASVLVAGLRSQLGASSLALEAIARQRVRPLVTTAVFLEYEAVLSRARHRLATGTSELDVDGRAAAIVTHNVTDFEPGSSRFEIRILTPARLFEALPKP
jgi:uncharacterized protein with PIN domain